MRGLSRKGDKGRELVGKKKKWKKKGREKQK